MLCNSSDNISFGDQKSEVEEIFNSYTMGMRSLPDTYTQSPRDAGPRAEGVYIRQTMSAHGITTMQNFHARTMHR